MLWESPTTTKSVVLFTFNILWIQDTRKQCHAKILIKYLWSIAKNSSGSSSDSGLVLFTLRKLLSAQRLYWQGRKCHHLGQIVDTPIWHRWVWQMGSMRWFGTNCTTRGGQKAVKMFTGFDTTGITRQRRSRRRTQRGSSEVLWALGLLWKGLFGS